MIINKNLYRRLGLMLPILAALILFCALPEDPTKDPQNVELTIQPFDSKNDSLMFGDSLKFNITVRYPHLIDSIVINTEDSSTILYKNILDTMMVSLLPNRPGKYPVQIIGYCHLGVIVVVADTVCVKNIPITLTRQPQCDTVVEGEAAFFCIAATGNPLPDIQWFQNTIAINGATGDTLQIDSIAVGINGSTFHARLANRFDTLWSEKAVLLVKSKIYHWNEMEWNNAVWH